MIRLLRAALSFACLLPLPLSAAKAVKERPPPAAAAIDPTQPRTLAFPEAEGFGAYAQGGRGGTVLRVTTLEDHRQPGSLRWAVSQRGPRTVVFAVEGLISLQQALEIEEPYLTLDGSTAPGAGITLKDGNIKVRKTHDIILRYIRVRPGDEPPLGKGAWQGHPRPIKAGDAITVEGCSDVIIDHVSASWSTDETISVTHSRRVTVQYCFITEPLGNPALHIEEGRPISHAFGALVGGDGVCYLKNYFAYFKIRGPQLVGSTPALPSRCAAINNLVAFYEDSGTRVKAAVLPSSYLVQNNFYRHPLKPGAPAIHLLASRLEKGTDQFIDPKQAVGQTHLCILGNLSPERTRADQDEWAAVRADFPADVVAQLRTDRPPFAVEPLTVLPTLAVEEHVLTQAGATLPRRDAIDARLVRQYRAGTGRVIHSQDEVGGYSRSAQTP